MTILNRIKDTQQQLEAHGAVSAMPQAPELLLIGCVDARKDPQADLGIPRGKALILRNIAALIRGYSVEPTQRETEAAALEFAVTVQNVPHIAVMGHTECGGIRAALDGAKDFPAIRQYLSPLQKLRQSLLDSDASMDEKAAIMEREAVKLSVRNLRTYHYIADAESAGHLQIHGWVMNTATGIIEVWNEETDSFNPMA